MVKKLKLKDDKERLLTIFGIVSSVNELKISWAINNTTGLKLARDENIKNPRSSKTEGFPVYSFEDEVNDFFYLLIINKSEGAFFIPSLKNLDYFFAIKGNSFDKNLFLSRLKQVSEIAATLEIDPGSIRESSIIKEF